MIYKYVKEPIDAPKKKKARKIINWANILASSIFFLVGVSILFYATFPYLSNFWSNLRGESKSSKFLLTPSPSEFLASAKSDVSSEQASSEDYVTNVNKNFAATNKLLNIDKRTFPEYANITGEMKLSIPSLKLDKLPIKINVNSFDEKTYMEQLDKSLAHFQGTSLPDKPGNTFIYGHSTNELLAKRYPNDSRYAFTFLENLNVGDNIVIEYNGKKYTYSAQRMKFVNPDDISPIYSTSDSQILTLMTCAPNGIGTTRLIWIAKLIEVK